MQEPLSRIIKIRAIEFPLKQGVILLELKGFADGIPAKVTGVRALFRHLRWGRYPHDQDEYESDQCS